MDSCEPTDFPTLATTGPTPIDTLQSYLSPSPSVHEDMDYTPLLHHRYYPDVEQQCISLSHILPPSPPAEQDTTRKRGASSASPPPQSIAKSRETSAVPPPPKRPRAAPSGPISTKDWVPPDVTGLGKREARLVKNRAAAFLSRQRKREEFELMEIRVQELEAENARLRQSTSSPGDDPTSDLRMQIDRSLERERTLEAQVRSLQAALLEAKACASAAVPVVKMEEEDVDDNEALVSRRDARESNSVKEKEKDKSHGGVAFMALIFSLSLLSTSGDNTRTRARSSYQPSAFSFSPPASPSPSSPLFSSRSPFDFSMDALLGKSALEDDAMLKYSPHEYAYGYDGMLDFEHREAEDHLGLSGSLGFGIGAGMDVGIGSISLGHHGYTTKSPSLSSLRSSLSTGVSEHSALNSPAKQVEIEIKRQSDSSDVSSESVSFGLRVRKHQSSGDGSDNGAASEKEKSVTVRVRKSSAPVTSPSGPALFGDRDEEEYSSRRSRTASPVPSLSSSSSTTSSASASPSIPSSSILSNTHTKSMGQITVQLKQALDASGDNVDLDLASLLRLGTGSVLPFGIEEDESIGSWEVVFE